MKSITEYISLVHFLGNALGKQCEVVLHDVTNLEHSIVAIANGHVSGRQVGGPLTDFTLKLLKNEVTKHENWVVNYWSQSKTGRKFRSSSYFLRNAKGQVIGVLCLNYDIQNYLDIRDVLDKLVLGPLAVDFMEKQSRACENFNTDAQSVIDAMIMKRLAPYEIEAKRLSVGERIKITKQLNHDGLFLLKGGISALARHLSVSEPTIYRYLQQIR